MSENKKAGLPGLWPVGLLLLAALCAGLTLFSDVAGGQGSVDPAGGGEEASLYTATPDIAAVRLQRQPGQPEAILWDNGPLVNCPGCGVGGADESVLQNLSLGMDTLGFGHQLALGYWVADDFQVSDADGWAVTSLAFFAYQTGSATTSTMTNVAWRIYDGQPGAGGSIVALGSGLDSTFWSGSYRVAEDTSGFATDRPIMEDRSLTPGLVLSPGVYWVAWQTDGTLASGPWAPPITITGQGTTGNARQSLDGGATWNPAEDGITLDIQGLPFVIRGTINTGPTSTPTRTPSPTPTRTPTPTPTGQPHAGGKALLPFMLYQVRTFFEGPWEQEDNDTPSTANGPLRPARDYFGYPNDQWDFFSIQTGASGLIDVSMTNFSGTDGQLLLYYQSTSSLVGQDTIAPFRIQYSGPAGVYYIAVFTAAGFNSNSAYTLRVSYPQ